MDPQNPELEARVQKLKAEQENKEYKEMTRNVDLGKSKKNEYASFGADVKSLNSQLVAVFNFLVTVAGAFTFGYKSVEFTVDTPNIPMQMCAGLICATIVFFADLYFLLKHTS